jgi:hypothetical protein
MPDLTWYQWVVLIGTPMLAVGSIAIDWALWKFIWTPFSKKLRRDLERNQQ